MHLSKGAKLMSTGLHRSACYRNLRYGSVSSHRLSRISIPDVPDSLSKTLNQTRKRLFSSTASDKDAHGPAKTNVIPQMSVETALGTLSVVSGAAARSLGPHVKLSHPNVEKKSPYNPEELAREIISGSRRALSRGITLIESSLYDHRKIANDVLLRLLKHQAQNRPGSEHATLVRSGLVEELPGTAATAAKEHATTKTTSSFSGTQLTKIGNAKVPASTWSQQESNGSDSNSESTAKPIDENDPLARDAAAQLEAASRALSRHGEEDLPLLTKDEGRPKTQLRIGISGTPGVGKSTFIESFGMYLIENFGLKVAVLTIDPSSQLTGGSILGDKTRMMRLSSSDNAYVRTSPSKGTLGGIAQNTAEDVLLCEAAGYDIVIIETVGVGQSEVSVAQTVDMVVLLMNPGSGDELQGIKKGIMELADLIVVTKADGALLAPAQRTKSDYEKSLHFFHTAGQAYGWHPQALLCSVVEEPERYMDSIWRKVLDFESAMLRPAKGIYSPKIYAHGTIHALPTTLESAAASEASATALMENMNVLQARRAFQRRQWMWSQLTEELLMRLRRFSKVGADVDRIERSLVENLVTPRVAAGDVFDLWLKSQNQPNQGAQQPDQKPEQQK